jgi:Ca2+-binding RTX toxin-like protein
MGDIQVRQYDAAGNVSAVNVNPGAITIDPPFSYLLPADVTSSSDLNDNDPLINNGNTGGDDVFVSSDSTLTFIYAGAGDDIVNVSLGSQTIFGGSGNDNITAGNGSDTLYGGSGADTLDGGVHGNHFYGGSGADIIIFGEGGAQGETAYFLFTTDTGDTVRNFKPDSSDKLNFSSMDADDNVSSSQSFVFIEQSSSDLSANSISWFYDATESRIQLAADTDGDTTTAEFVIYIENQFVQTLTSADVIL